MKIYDPISVWELSSEMETTVVQSTVIDDKTKEKKVLSNAKDVAKRKKEIRVGIAFVARSEKETASRLLSEAIGKNNEIRISAKELRELAVSLCSQHEDLLTTITGSSKYGEIGSNLMFLSLVRTLIDNYSWSTTTAESSK